MAVNLIRILALLLAVLALAIALVPMLVLIDLVTGGTGYGLCSGGIERCDLPFTTGPELLILLTIGLFGIVMVIRWLMRLARRLQKQSGQSLVPAGRVPSSEQSVPNGGAGGNPSETNLEDRV